MGSEMCIRDRADLVRDFRDIARIEQAMALQRIGVLEHAFLRPGNSHCAPGIEPVDAKAYKRCSHWGLPTQTRIGEPDKGTQPPPWRGRRDPVAIQGKNMMGDPRNDAAKTSYAYEWYVVLICMLAYIFSFVDRQILALMIEPIKHDPVSYTHLTLPTILLV